MVLPSTDVLMTVAEAMPAGEIGYQQIVRLSNPAV